MISTHTLTWSVTTAVLFHAVQLIISTHTLTWSVTTAEQHWLYPNYHFNSHAHVERDNSLKAIDIIISISTHTLTWSVTTYSFDDCKQSAFQLTRSRGA